MVTVFIVVGALFWTLILLAAFSFLLLLRGIAWLILHIRLAYKNFTRRYAPDLDDCHDPD